MREAGDGFPKNSESGRDSEVRLAETVAITLSGDALSCEELERLPDLSECSMHAQGILAMSAVGYCQADIAEAHEITQQAVSDLVRRVDPGGAFRLSAESKRAFVSKLAEGKAIAAMSSITLSDIKESSAVEKARVAKTLMDLSSSLTQSKHKEVSASRLDSLLEQVENERLNVPIAEAEILEEEGK